MVNSDFLLAAKVKVFNCLLAAGGANPFEGAGNLAQDWQKQSVKLAIILMSFGAVIMLAVYSLGGQELQNKMKSKLGRVILGIIGISAVVGGAVGWLSSTTSGWFGG